MRLLVRWVAIIALAVAFVCLPFDWRVSVGVLLGAFAGGTLFARISIFVPVLLAGKKVTLLKIVYNTAIKVCIVAAALLAASLLGIPAVLGLFVGVTAALAGLVVAALISQRNKDN